MQRRESLRCMSTRFGSYHGENTLRSCQKGQSNLFENVSLRFKGRTLEHAHHERFYVKLPNLNILSAYYQPQIVYSLVTVDRGQYIQTGDSVPCLSYRGNCGNTHYPQRVDSCNITNLHASSRSTVKQWGLVSSATELYVQNFYWWFLSSVAMTSVFCSISCGKSGGSSAKRWTRITPANFKNPELGTVQYTMATHREPIYWTGRSFYSYATAS